MGRIGSIRIGVSPSFLEDDDCNVYSLHSFKVQSPSIQSNTLMSSSSETNAFKCLSTMLKRGKDVILTSSSSSAIDSPSQQELHNIGKLIPGSYDGFSLVVNERTIQEVMNFNDDVSILASELYHYIDEYKRIRDSIDNISILFSSLSPLTTKGKRKRHCTPVNHRIDV